MRLWNQFSFHKQANGNIIMRISFYLFLLTTAMFLHLTLGIPSLPRRSNKGETESEHRLDTGEDIDGPTDRGKDAKKDWP